MADTRNGHDDRLPPPDEFDPRQWAIHGLLARHFDPDPRANHARPDTLIAHWKSVSRIPNGYTVPVPSGALQSSPLTKGGPRGVLIPRTEGTARGVFTRPNIRRYVILGTLLAAACLLLWAFFFREPGRDQVAFADPVNAVGPDLLLTPYDVNSVGINVVAIESECRTRQQTLDDWKTRIAANPSNLSETPVQDDSTRISKDELMQLWASIYRDLRRIGRYDEALRSAQAASSYATANNPTGRVLGSWPWICMNDIGAVCAAAGDYAAAGNAFEESIRLRETEARRQPAGVRPDHLEAERIMARAHILPPLLWQKSYLALLQNDIPAAWEQHHRAEAILREYFAAIAAAVGTSIAADASAYDAFSRCPPEFQLPANGYTVEEAANLTREFAGFRPNASIVQKLRAHLVRTARLLRLEGRFDDARLLLGQATKIAHSACHDEERTDFALFVELARVALLQRRPDVALQFVATAEASAGPKSCALDPGNDKQAITGLPLLELDLLQAAALLAYADANEPRAPASGPSPSPTGEGRGEGIASQRAQASRQAIDLLTRTLATIDQIAASLPENRRQSFLNQFTEWRALLRKARSPTTERSTL